MDEFIHVSLFWLFVTLYNKHKHFLCMWCSIYVCDLGLIHPLTVKVEFTLIISSDVDTIGSIAVENKFIIIFDGIKSNTDKLSKFEYNYVTNSSIMTNSFCTISGVAIVIVLLVDVVYFVIQVVDESSLNISLLIELDAITVKIAQWILYLAIESSISPGVCKTQLMHHVCVVFCYLFYFFYFLSIY